MKLPLDIDIHNLIDDLRILSWEASDILLNYSNLLKSLQNTKELIKSSVNEDPVTLADLEVNDLVIKRLQEIYKGEKLEILSEENVKTQNNNSIKNSEWLWVLDPLDGTRDFIQGTGHYAMHLALNYNQKPYLGLVLIPERNELWFSNSKKVWCENRQGMKYKPKVHKNKPLNEMTLVISKNHSNQILKQLIDKIKFKKVNEIGSIGCKVASIIRGESDIYISWSLPGGSAPKDWDFAAPEAILNVFGGRISTLGNRELTYSQPGFRQSGFLMASRNKDAHNTICNELKVIIERSKFPPNLF